VVVLGVLGVLVVGVMGAAKEARDKKDGGDLIIKMKINGSRQIQKNWFLKFMTILTVVIKH
jgi:hypothetical protein